MLYKERGVFNRVQSSTVCNASATNFGRIPIFPPFSVTQTLISVTQEIIKREYRNAYKPWKLLMFPGFFAFPETLWNVVKRGEKESREYIIQAGRRPWRTIAAGN